MDAAKKKAFFELLQPRKTSRQQDDETNITAAEVVVETQDNENFTIINNDVPIEFPAQDASANLDIDEDNLSEEELLYDIYDVNKEEDQSEGVQREYVKAIQQRLKEETHRHNNSTNLWLLQHLKDNGWWIRKEQVRCIVKKLGLKKEYNAYYWDV